MGVTFLKLKITNPERPRKKSQTLAFLVDSGAVYSVVPQSILKRLAIKPTHFQEFILANGETVKRSVGNAYFEYQGKVGAAPVVFGDEGVFLLGATTLESLGMILDPIRRELKPLPMLLMMQRTVEA
jgi:predicted aspartyl protease